MTSCGFEKPFFLITLEPCYTSTTSTLINGIKLYGRCADGSRRSCLVTDAPCYFYVRDTPRVSLWVESLEKRLRQALFETRERKRARPLTSAPLWADEGVDTYLVPADKCLKRDGSEHDARCRWQSEAYELRQDERKVPVDARGKDVCWTLPRHLKRKYRPRNVPCVSRLLRYVRGKEGPTGWPLHRFLRVEGTPVLRSTFDHFTSKPQEYRRIHVQFDFLRLVILRVWKWGVDPDPYELHVCSVARFQADHKLVGCGWLVAPEEATCAEVSVRQDGAVAPLRVCSFDIEVVNTEGEGFPKPRTAQVLCISAVVLGETYLLSAAPSVPLPGVTVLTYATEEELLVGWRNFILEQDVDILTGWNICNFDLSFLLERAAWLSRECEALKAFAYCGLDPSRPWYQYTDFYENDVHYIPGRIILDGYKAIKADRKLRSYKLDSVAKLLKLGAKEDVAWNEIGPLWRSGPEGVARVLSYCAQDSQLVVDILAHEETVLKRVEMARVTGISLADICDGGMSPQVERMILRKAEGFLLPTYESRFYRDGRKPEKVTPYLTDRVHASLRRRARPHPCEDHRSEGVPKYEGAIVLEPKRNFYNTTTLCLDFASLYPSICRAFNLSHDTLHDEPYTVEFTEVEGDWMSVNVTPCHETPNGYFFVDASVREGVLPKVVRELLHQRKQVKRAMRNADAVSKPLLNARQLALKTCANSVYGYTAMRNARSTCLPVASSITAHGRKMIMETRDYVEKTYPDCEVVYGDTDSVFVKTGKNLNEALAFGRHLEEELNNVGLYCAPNYLEFEKAYRPYLLLGKKKYAGFKYELDGSGPIMDVKGIEIVRRDTFPFMTTTQKEFLDLWFRQSFDAAVTYLQHALTKMARRQVPIAGLTYTKELKKWDLKAAHVYVAKELRRRNPNNPPRLGERIEYVYKHNLKSSADSESAVSPSLLTYTTPVEMTLQGISAKVDVPVHILREQNRSLVLMTGASVVPQGTSITCYEIDISKYRRKMINPFVTLMECFTGLANARALMNYNPDHICNRNGPVRTDYVTRKRQRRHQGGEPPKVIRRRLNHKERKSQRSIDEWTRTDKGGYVFRE